MQLQSGSVLFPPHTFQWLHIESQNLRDSQFYISKWCFTFKMKPSEKHLKWILMTGLLLFYNDTDTTTLEKRIEVFKHKIWVRGLGPNNQMSIITLVWISKFGSPYWNYRCVSKFCKVEPALANIYTKLFTGSKEFPVCPWWHGSHSSALSKTFDPKLLNTMLYILRHTSVVRKPGISYICEITVGNSTFAY